jgi:outer membrane biosynthesis protein TonB
VKPNKLNLLHLQLVPTMKPTPAPVPTPPPVPVPVATTVPVPDSTTAPEPVNPTPDQTQPPVQAPDFVLPGASAAPSPGAGTTDENDNFSSLYGAPSSAYIHSNSVTAVIAIGSAMVWTLAGFL